MSKKHRLILFKTGFGLLGFSAVVTEIATLTERNVFNPANFFSYFTIQSNIFAFLMLLISALYIVGNRKSASVKLLRGASTLYMVITGIVFAVLLAGVEGSVLTAVPWDNIVLHYIMPVALLIDWVIDKPVPTIEFRKALVWLIYPLVYVAYSLVRGHFVDWYPYPFLNPSTNGYINVLITGLGIAGLTLVLTYALVKLTRNKVGSLQSK